MTIQNEMLREALRSIEANAQDALAHQPEDDGSCWQFLYDALVRVFNVADRACHTARATRRGCAA
jgi:hypothetical protein